MAKKKAKKVVKKATKKAAKKAPAKKAAKKVVKKATKKVAKKATKKVVKKAVKKAAAKKPAAKKTKRTINPALLKPYTPSEDLAKVVGANPIPRTQVVKKLWDYIKANKLQDTKNRRMINADDKLLPVFSDKKQVSMFEMSGLISKHLK